MTRCVELVGKVVEKFTLYEDGPYGPEIQIEFTDGTSFNACVSTRSKIEARLLHNSPSQSEVLKVFTPESAVRTLELTEPTTREEVLITELHLRERITKE